MRMLLCGLSIAGIALLTACGPQSELGSVDAGPDELALGTVHFENSCDTAAKDEINRGVALLHSFWFRVAVESFERVLATDATCAIAEWGIAMAHWGNPLLSNRPKAQLAKGAAAVERAQAMDAGSAREGDYIAAVAELYRDFETTKDRERAVAFEKKMEALVNTYPDDPEAAIFYAMALNGTADPRDKSYAQQLRAAAILEREFKTKENHPGIAHYLIHTYDVPSLAKRALTAARAYAGIAPAAPHALHMPSHTFTRLGYWQESIDTNARSTDAALHAGSPSEALHALDYMAYAYLQTGRDTQAHEVVERAARVEETVDWQGPYAVAGAYALAAIPARYTLERGDWAAAAALPPRSDRAAFTNAIVRFARGLGAARGGDAGAARAEAKALAEARDELPAGSYWAEKVEIQRMVVEAWATHAAGDPAGALRAMQVAAEREDATEKHAVSPGPIAPARELLGEMLLLLDRPAESLEAFRATIAKEPGRFRGLYGGALAASASGDHATARSYYQALVELCASAGESVRPELEAARQAVATGG